MCLGPPPIGCELSPDLWQAQVLRWALHFPESLKGGAGHEWHRKPGSASLVCDCGHELPLWRLLKAAAETPPNGPARALLNLLDECWIAQRKRDAEATP